MRALELNAHRIAHEESIAAKFDLGKNVRLVHLLMSQKLINTFSTLREWLKI